MLEQTTQKARLTGKSSLFPVILYVFLALLLTFVTFLLENRATHMTSANNEVFGDSKVRVEVSGRNEVDVKKFGSSYWDRFPNMYELNSGDTIKTNNSSGTVIYFPDNSLLRLDANSEITVDFDGADYNVNFIKGRMWINTLYASSNLYIKGGDVLVEPLNAVSVLSVENGRYVIHGYRLHTRVYFYENDKLLNTLLVTEGNRIEVNFDKLKEKLEKVMYSKLVKEFHYGYVDPETLKEDAWYAENVARDNAFLETVSAKKIQFLRERPINNISQSSLGYKLKKLINGLSSYFVIEDEKRSAHQVDFLMDHLEDSETLFASYALSEARDRLISFEEVLNASELTSNQGVYTAFIDSLLNEFEFLVFSVPKTDLFPLRDLIRSVYLEFSMADASGDSASDRFSVMRSYLNDAFYVIDSDSNTARDLMDDYYDRLKTIMSAYAASDNNALGNILIEENQVFDSLLLRSPALYEDMYFSYKSFLEEKWLSSIADDEEAVREEKRMMIGKKIIFLQRLRDYFLSDQVSLDDAKSVLYRLFNEIEKYKQNIPSAGIDEMFKNNLSDLGLFWDFLNNPEYSVSLTHGTTRNERYDAFLGIQQGGYGIEDLRKKILGSSANESDVGTLYDVKKGVVDVFVSIGASSIVLGDLASKDQRFVDVSGVFEGDIYGPSGVKFSSTYDREEKFLTDIFVNGDFLTSGVRIEKLPMALETYVNAGKLVGTGEVEEPAPGEATIKVETKEEKISKLLLIEKLSSFGFEGLAVGNVAVVDFDKSIFAVDYNHLSESGEVLYSVSFQIDALNDMTSKIVLHLPEFDKELSDKVAISEFLNFVKDAFSNSGTENSDAL